MNTSSPDDFTKQPQRLLSDAQRGEASLVMDGGVAVLLAVPLGAGIEAPEVRVEFAARLFDREQISLGLAAQIAGLSYSEMVDQLGRRGIAVIRLGPDELERELAAFGD